MMLAEIQLFKGVENYFTDSLLYQENNEPVKEPLPNDVDSCNEVNSKSKEDLAAIFTLELIIAYLDDPDCNNPAENEGEWVLNENVAFVTFCVLKMYLNLSILVPCIYLYSSRK